MESVPPRADPHPCPTQAAPSQRPAALALFAGVAALVVPVVLVAMPPLLDYPNHLARLWLLAGGADIPPVASMYGVDWGHAWTNIGMDLAAAALGRPGQVWALGKLLLALALVLPTLGAALLNRTLFGRFHWWQAPFALLAWNTTLVAGFINFHISLGLALLGAAADPALARAGRLPRILARAAIAALILVVHPIPLVAYAACLGGMALGAGLHPLDPVRRLGRAVAAVLPTFLPVLVVVLFAPSLPGAEDSTPATDWSGFFNIFHKRDTLFSAFWTYELRIDIAVPLIFIALLGWSLWHGRVRAHAGLLLAAICAGALSLVLPDKVAGGYWIDHRFPIIAALMGAAALHPSLDLAPRAAARLALVLLATVAFRTAWIGWIWQRREADLAAVERLLGRVPAGSAILPIEHTPRMPTWEAPWGRYINSGEPSYWHFVVLAIPLRHAFVPSLFAKLGLQPVFVRPPWDAMAEPQINIVSIHRLVGTPPEALVAMHARYVVDWRDRYDYALLVNADIPDREGPMALPPGLELVGNEGFARLYKVSPGPAPAFARRFSP